MAGAPASNSLRGTDMPSRIATKTMKYSIATGLHRVCVCVCVCVHVCVCVCARVFLWQVKHKPKFLSTDQHKRNRNTRILLLQRAKSVCVCTIPTVVYAAHNRLVVQTYSHLCAILCEPEAHRKGLWCGLCWQKSNLRRDWYCTKYSNYLYRSCVVEGRRRGWKYSMHGGGRPLKN